MKKLLAEVFSSPVNTLLAFVLIAAATVPALTNSINLFALQVDDYGGLTHHRVAKAGAVLGDFTAVQPNLPPRGQQCSGADSSASSTPDGKPVPQVCVMYELGNYNQDKNRWDLSVNYQLKGLRSGSLYLDDQALVKRVYRSGQFKQPGAFAPGDSHNLIFYAQTGGKGQALVTLNIVAPSGASSTPQSDSNGFPPMMPLQDFQGASNTPVSDCNFPAAPAGFHYVGRAQKVCAILLVKDGAILSGPPAGQNGQEQGQGAAYGKNQPPRLGVMPPSNGSSTPQNGGNPPPNGNMTPSGGDQPPPPVNGSTTPPMPPRNQ